MTDSFKAKTTLDVGKQSTRSAASLPSNLTASIDCPIR